MINHVVRRGLDISWETKDDIEYYVVFYGRYKEKSIGTLTICIILLCWMISPVGAIITAESGWLCDGLHDRPCPLPRPEENRENYFNTLKQQRKPGDTH